MNSKLDALIRKHARPRIISSIILIAIALTLLYINRSFIKSKTTGADTVATVMDVMTHYNNGDTYISIKLDEIFDLDLIVETTNTRDGRVTSKRNTSYFVAGYVEDMLFVVELPYKYYNDITFSYENVELSGKLKESSGSLDVINEVANMVANSYSIPRSMVLGEYLIPIYLDTLTNQTDYVFSIIGVILLIIALLLFVPNLIRIINPKTHSVYKDMRKLGDIDTVSSSLEREISDGSSYIIANPGKYSYLTKSYILSVEGGKLKLSETKDMLWAYRHEFNNRGTVTHSVIMRFYDRKPKHSFVVKNPSEAAALIRAIYTNLPVVCGYSDELNKIYLKNQPEFQRLLDSRRAEFNAGTREISSVDVIFDPSN